MAYSYTRQSTISDGDTITAALFNNEYNQLLNAFAYSSSDAAATGHRHDGSAAHGGSIAKIGDLDFLNKIAADSTNNRWGIFVEVSSTAVEQIRIQDGAIVPVTDNDIDLGTSSVEFKDAFFDGTVTTDTLTVDVNATVGGTLGVTGALTGSSTLQGTTITATTAFVPDASDGAALGTSALEFSDLYLADGAVVYFGDDQDVSLTHVVDTGLLLSSTDQLQFGDSGTYIYQSADGVLDLVSDTEIELTATTIDINGAVDVSGEIIAASLDISGNADIDGTLEADAITVDGTALATYIRDTVGTNMLSSNTESGITVTYDTSNDNIDFAVDAAQTGITSLLATDIKIGEDDQTKIDFETADTINFYAGNEKQLILTNGALTPGSNAIVDLGTDALEFKDAYFDGTVEADDITIAGTALATYIRDTVGTNMLSSNTESGITVTYDTSNDNIDFAIDAAQTGITSIYATDLILGEDSQTAIDFGTANEIDFKVDNAARLTLTTSDLYPVTDSQIDLGTASLEFKDAYFDGTVTSDAFVGPLTGAVTGNADTATTATTATNVTASANDSTDETVYPTFVDGATGGQGIETDTGLTYNPSSGTLTSTVFVGALTGNVTGNASGTAATVTTAAQSNITSLGTLTTLTVDNININGTTIGHTSDTDLLTLASGGLTALGTITVGVDEAGHDVKFF